MKFLCSFLILAGVFALNDAFPSSDGEDRLAYDKIMLEDLQRMADNRDASTAAECSKIYMAAVTECLGSYNSGLADCDNATQSKIAGLNEEAIGQIKQLVATVEETCPNNCISEEEASDALTCLGDQTSKNAGVLTRVSVDAATYKAELTKAISDAQGLGVVCTQQCYSDYSKKSQEAENQFRSCTQNKSQSF